jgi:usherin
LKWYSNQKNPFIANGQVTFGILVTGPFLIDLNSVQLIQYLKQLKPVTEIKTINLLNTSVMNTRYGIMDRILANSVYTIQINASNSKGYILSNQVSVKTFQSLPEYIISPQFLTSNTNSMQIEWFDPVLPNSIDQIFYFQITYRIKYLWNATGPISFPIYEEKLVQVFSSKTISKFLTIDKLKPFTAYSFQLTVSNSFGQVQSDWSDDYLTQEDLPKLQQDPIISNINSNSIILKWQPPLYSNGLINTYHINVYQNTTDSIYSIRLRRNITISANKNSVLLDKLESFAYYLVNI